VDPLTKSYPMLTPYQFASNTPIWAIDLDGLEALTLQQKEQIIVNNYPSLQSGNIYTIKVDPTPYIAPAGSDLKPIYQVYPGKHILPHGKGRYEVISQHVINGSEITIVDQYSDVASKWLQRALQRKKNQIQLESMQDATPGFAFSKLLKWSDEAVDGAKLSKKADKIDYDNYGSDTYDDFARMGTEQSLKSIQTAVRFGDNFPKKVRKHIDQVRKRYDGIIDDIPSPGKGGLDRVQEIITKRISQGGGYPSTYAGEAATFFKDGNVVYVVRESGEFWTILKNTK